MFTSSFLTQSASVLNIPCIVTEQNPEKLGSTCKEINISGAKVFSKNLFSMNTPEVVSELNNLNRKSAVLFGLETHVCIFQTALDLIQKNYDVHIVVDGVSSQRDFDRATALERLKNIGCFLTTSESLIFALIKSADHQNFKQISNLAKQYSTSLSKIERPLSLL